MYVPLLFVCYLIVVVGRSCRASSLVFLASSQKKLIDYGTSQSCEIIFTPDAHRIIRLAKKTSTYLYVHISHYHNQSNTLLPCKRTSHLLVICQIARVRPTNQRPLQKKSFTFIDFFF